MADFVGCATGGERAAGVAVDGSFAQRAGGDGEFDETASLRLERPGFLGGGAERFIGAHDGRILLAELLEARRNLLMVLWLGFGFSIHEFKGNQRCFFGGTAFFTCVANDEWRTPNVECRMSNVDDPSNLDADETIALARLEALRLAPANVLSFSQNSFLRN